MKKKLILDGTFVFHYIVIGRKKFLSADRFQKSTHVEGSVSGLPVGPLSVLSHYTSIEFYIYM